MRKLIQQHGLLIGVQSQNTVLFGIKSQLLQQVLIVIQYNIVQSLGFIRCQRIQQKQILIHHAADGGVIKQIGIELQAGLIGIPGFCNPQHHVHTGRHMTGGNGFYLHRCITKRVGALRILHVDQLKRRLGQRWITRLTFYLHRFQ